MCERGMGSAVGQEPALNERITSWAVEYSTVPVLVKLTPNVDEIGPHGLAAQAGGAVPHASTFGGNPLATAAAGAVLEIIERDGLLAQVTSLGEHLGAALDGLVQRHGHVALEARGRGLLRGLRVKENAAGVVARAREQGVLLSLAGADVVRFAPSYVVTTAQLDEAVATLGQALEA